MNRFADIQRFYAILAELEAILGGKRVLADCQDGSLFPPQGVYFFFEPGETRTDSGNGLRLVRKGTHAVSRGAQTKLWQRLSQHKGSRRTGGGNHRGSVFRLLLGKALMHKHPHLHSATWGMGSHAPADIRRSELGLEMAVSEYIREMPFLWLAVEGESHPNNLRSYMEKNAIALLSNRNKGPIDKPSESWLGLLCPREIVQESGLWNRRHTDSVYDPNFLDIFERLVREFSRNAGDEDTRFLDMSPYRPYRDMAQTCQTRPIRKKVVRWIKPEPWKNRDERFVGRPLARGDIEAAAELWRHAYPELYGSSHDFMLYPEDYETRMALAETWEEDSLKKPCCMLVVQEVSTGRLAAASLMTKYDQNLQIEWTFVGSHPDYRKMGLMGMLGDMMDWMCKVSGAEYLTTFLETWHTITQAETLKIAKGWQLAGIFPGNFTRWAGGQQEYRACEVHMYRFINEGEKYDTKPEEWQLHPELQRLWEALEDFNRRSTGKD